MVTTVAPVVNPVAQPEVAEIAVGREMVEIPEEAVAPEPVAVDPNRPLRRKKT